jgi:hypothetical protein
MQAAFLINHAAELFCTVDGVPVGPLNSYRVSSPQFKFDAPTPWVAGPTGGKGKAVGDGYYVLLEPLPKGDHTIHFGGKLHFNAGEVPELGPDAVDLALDVTYNVKVK